MKQLIKKRWVRVILIAAALYLGAGIYWGHQMHTIMASAFESYTFVENNPYAEVISDEYYNRLVHRADYDFTLPGAYDKYLLGVPIVLHWFTGAVVYIAYDYEYYSGDGYKSGSWGIPVKFTLKLDDCKWRVVDIYEAP